MGGLVNYGGGDFFCLAETHNTQANKTINFGQNLTTNKTAAFLALAFLPVLRSKTGKKNSPVRRLSTLNSKLGG